MGPFFPSSWVRILKLFDDFFADFLSIFDKNGSAPPKKLGKRLSLCLNVSFFKTKKHVPYFFCSIWLQLYQCGLGANRPPSFAAAVCAWRSGACQCSATPVS